MHLSLSPTTSAMERRVAAGISRALSLLAQTLLLLSTTELMFIIGTALVFTLAQGVFSICVEDGSFSLDINQRRNDGLLTLSLVVTVTWSA